VPELVQLDAAAIPELAGLAVATLPYDDCSPTLLRYTFFSGPEVDPGLTLGLKEDGRLVAVAIGIVTPGYQGGIWGHVKLVATVPSHQRRGHAARLLKTLEEAFVSKGATLAIVSFAQRYYVPGVDLRYSKALCLFDRLGYQRDHFTYNLAVDLQHRSFDLAPLQVRLAEEGITVRRIEQVDHDRFQQYMSERWNPGWQSEAMQSLDPERDPAPGHIALLDQEIVGFSVYDISRPGWLGPIGTNKELRGRDVGTALLHACLYDWQRSGRHYGEIAGIGPLYFYVTSCDAVICRAFQQYSKQLA
jgi:GNAT superfamily N-acetyltransferase